MGASLTAEVTKTLPFQTIGDDQPTPGTSVTHSTFLVVDQVLGRFGLSDTGLAPNPLN